MTATRTLVLTGESGSRQANRARYGPPTRRQANEFYTAMGFVLPATFVLVGLTGFPLVQVVLNSLREGRGTDLVGMQNYLTVLQDGKFWASSLHTIVFTVASISLALLIAFTLAVLLDQPIDRRVRGVIRSLFMIPWLLSSAVVGVLWVMMLNPFGFVNVGLTTIGLTMFDGLPWLSLPGVAMIGIIVANVWRAVPFMTIMILAGLQTVPRELYEAAALDGCGFFRQLRYVTIPQITSVVLTITTLELIWAFRAFDLIYVMTGGGPQGSTEVLSTYVYNEAFRDFDFGTSSAAAILMLIVMLAMASLYLRRMISKENR